MLKNVVAENLTKKMKLHLLSQRIYQNAVKIINIMFGEEYEKEILKITVSDNAVSVYKACLKALSHK
jgi:hypothetical protein